MSLQKVFVVDSECPKDHPNGPCFASFPVALRHGRIGNIALNRRLNESELSFLYEITEQVKSYTDAMNHALTLDEENPDFSAAKALLESFAFTPHDRNSIGDESLTLSQNCL